MNKKTIKFTENFFKKFKRNTKLVNLVRKGFDVYTKESAPYSYTWERKTFYETAIKWGSPELLQACLDMGANPNCFDLEEGANSSPPAATSTLVTAMRALRPDNLKVLWYNTLQGSSVRGGY